ncbi:hypothetical protein E4K65_15275 [Bradyrhizobium niftali]|uniref:Uncharacterized protein n=1 Tax=Bradyrhizobium niftali TaxID=2560055 RepID=A0A4Y9LXJ9_9BRAD|nr:hypothetical protein E4K65_15275 [Bradyrhizobium niftali]
MPRLDRGIPYAAASRFGHDRLGVLDRPVKPGDDSSGGGRPAAFGDIPDTSQAAAPPQTALTFAEIGTT